MNKISYSGWDENQSRKARGVKKERFRGALFGERISSALASGEQNRELMIYFSETP
jgi:hypothetical protein